MNQIMSILKLRKTRKRIHSELRKFFPLCNKKKEGLMIDEKHWLVFSVPQGETGSFSKAYMDIFMYEAVGPFDRCFDHISVIDSDNYDTISHRIVDSIERYSTGGNK